MESDTNEEDGTEARQLAQVQDELRRCREQLHFEALRRADFLIHLNQELRTRLTAIMGFAELLVMKLGSDDNVQQILKGGQEVLEMINRELAEPLESDGTLDTTAKALWDVLCIEDNPANFMLIERILEERPSLKVFPAMRGETGLFMAQSQRPRLILLDLNLPDIHGSEVLQRLQKNPATARIPVVVISADATPSQIERLLVLGARNYLTKPFEVEPFLAVIDEIMQENAVVRAT